MRQARECRVKMSLSVRKTQAAAIYAQVKASRELRLELAALNSKIHASISLVASTSSDYKNPAGSTDAVSAANASDLATSITLADAITAFCNRHAADDGAHKAAYSSAPIATTALSTLSDVQTRANAIKTWYETHRASTTYHPTADSTNTISSASATDQSSANTLLNELKTDINAHVASGFTSFNLRLVDP